MVSPTTIQIAIYIAIRDLLRPSDGYDYEEFPRFESDRVCTGELSQESRSSARDNSTRRAIEKSSHATGRSFAAAPITNPR